MICSCIVDFLPRPTVWAAWIRLTAMLLAAKARRMETNWPLLEPTLQSLQRKRPA
jgi:hypothetical protein